MKNGVASFYKDIQLAINPFKSCMRQRKAFRTDIFFEFDLKNDLLTMTLKYNHFENKCNQLRHLENPTINTKIVKIGPWTPVIYHFRYTVDLAEKRGLKGSKIWILWFSRYLNPNDAISASNSIWAKASRQLNFGTSQPPLNIRRQNLEGM